MKALSLEGNKHLSQSEIMAEVCVLPAHAAQYYSSLNMSNYWNLPQNQRVNMVNTTTEIKC